MKLYELSSAAGANRPSKRIGRGPAILEAGADGTAAADDFIEGAVSECFVASDVFSTVLAYDKSKFPDGAPTKLADFFDQQKFPGKRAMRKGAKVNLEMALMADGVAPGDVYAMLDTPEGLDRAFAKLDTIKKDVVWWESSARSRRSCWPMAKSPWRSPITAGSSTPP